MAEGDVAALGLSVLALGALVALAELLHHRLGWSSIASRRLVHLGTGLFVVAIPLFFRDAAPVYLLAVTFVLVNGVTATRGWLRGIHPADRDSRGTIAFPLALLAVLPFCWEADRQFILQVAFLVLAVADPLAAMVGERYARRRFRIGAATKSPLGSATFFLAAWLLTAAGLTYAVPSSSEASVWTIALLSSLVAIVATAVEALGGKGWDNFFVVVAVVAVLGFWQLHPDRLGMMALGALVGLAFALFAWRMRYLTLSGSIAGGLFAATLTGAGGWGWMAPGFAFFLLSSLLSKRAAAWKDPQLRAAGGKSRRDASQVYANGGIAWLLVLAFGLAPHAWIYWGFVGSLAAAAADTWATELGPRFGQQPRLILGLRRVPAGTSGAVTWGGTLSGAVGALVVWTVAWWTAGDAMRLVGMATSLGGVVVGATLGSLVDSLSGASIQAVYRDPDSGWTTDEPSGARDDLNPIRGWRHIDNNVVNGACTAVGAAVAMVIVGVAGR